jgi:hypothetical protein
MMSLKLAHLQIHWGLAGAREKFEEMVSQLIHVERPDSQRIRIVKGDGGLDSFEGTLTDPNGIDVFQVKYFPAKIDDAQKNQIRESFATVHDSKKFKVKSWTLCLPIDLSLDETEWFDRWVQRQADTGIDIRTPWGELKLVALLLQEKNRAIRETFFREENMELLRAQAGHLEKILHELTQRGILQMTLKGVKSRNTYRWTGGKLVIEVMLCFLLTNIGPRSVPKWKTGGNFYLSDDALGKRFVSKEEFPRIGSGNSYIYTDCTILPTTSLTTEQIFGVMVRETENFDETLPRILNAISATFWPITDKGPGEKTTVNLSEVLDWEQLLPSFQQGHMMALSQTPAE